MIVSVFLTITTFATNDYSGILRTAAVSAFISACGLCGAWLLGTKHQRLVVIVVMLPLIFAVSEIVRRT